MCGVVVHAQSCVCVWTAAAYGGGGLSIGINGNDGMTNTTMTLSNVTVRSNTVTLGKWPIMIRSPVWVLDSD